MGKDNKGIFIILNLFFTFFLEQVPRVNVGLFEKEIINMLASHDKK